MWECSTVSKLEVVVLHCLLGLGARRVEMTLPQDALRTRWICSGFSYMNVVVFPCPLELDAHRVEMIVAKDGDVSLRDERCNC